MPELLRTEATWATEIPAPIGSLSGLGAAFSKSHFAMDWEADWIANPLSGMLLGSSHMNRLITDSSAVGVQGNTIGSYIERIKGGSRWILSLSENWDDEGSPGFAVSTWERAIDFLEAQAEWLLKSGCIALRAPRVLPGPEGTIDIHWEAMDRELLINIPANENEPISFYGDDRGAKSIQGKIGGTEATRWAQFIAYLMTE